MCIVVKILTLKITVLLISDTQILTLVINKSIHSCSTEVRLIRLILLVNYYSNINTQNIKEGQHTSTMLLSLTNLNFNRITQSYICYFSILYYAI